MRKTIDEAPAASLRDHVAALEDPRVERTKRHHLLDILTIAVCAVICGADSWVEIEAFGTAKFSWFRSFLDLPNGLPSHDTFGVSSLRLICFRRWMWPATGPVDHGTCNAAIMSRWSPRMPAATAASSAMPLASPRSSQGSSPALSRSRMRRWPRCARASSLCACWGSRRATVR